MSKIVSLAISLLVFIEVGHYLGIPITTLLASAGVGGLAVALAAQDTVKNLFGTIMLMADKPFRVGERIVAAGYDGVVENIGLRSTRLRLLTGHQVTIPNDTLACNDVENVGRRPFIRRVSNIQIPLVTP
jgi:MscS family membrane protein